MFLKQPQRELEPIDLTLVNTHTGPENSAWSDLSQQLWSKPLHIKPGDLLARSSAESRSPSIHATTDKTLAALPGLDITCNLMSEPEKRAIIDRIMKTHDGKEALELNQRLMADDLERDGLAILKSGDKEKNWRLPASIVARTEKMELSESRRFLSTDFARHKPGPCEGKAD
jgi:hypothetical protein